VADGWRFGLSPVAVALIGAALLLFVTLATIADEAARRTTAPTTTQAPAPPPTTTTAAHPVGIAVAPGQSIQAAVDAAPAGSTFVIEAGVHTQQTVRPKSRDVFVGDAGAVLSGARRLSGWVQAGPVWSVGGQTQEGPAYGECEADSPRCDHPEDLFVDDVLLKHVASLAEVGPGDWFFDYASDTIFIGDDPAGRRVEVSVTPTAFTGLADDVVIRNLTVEKYATNLQEGVIQAGPRPGGYPGGGRGWLIEDTTVRWNHGVGVAMGENTVVRRVRSLANGNLGLSGTSASGGLVEDSELAYNNTAGVAVGWAAGGAKFAGSYDNLVVRRCNNHHNVGIGLWSDESDYNTTFVDNVVTDNTNAGIAVEISYKALVKGNIVRRNGFARGTDWLWGSGIEIAASSDVEVTANIVEDNNNAIAGIQQARGTGPRGVHLLTNLWVHDNTIRLAAGGAGIVNDDGDSATFTTRNNRFTANTWAGSTRTYAYAWNNRWITQAGWRISGNS
jgi:parallel beta-helix repeat protein